MGEQIRFLHLSDLHLGIETHGRLNTATGLNTRLEDVLGSLDTAVDEAVRRRVHAVFIAGDIFHKENPSPTEEIEFARRIRRLVSETDAHVVITLGNHDYPSATRRAAAVEIFPALTMERVYVARAPAVLRLETEGVPLQVACLPWARKGALLTKDDIKSLPVDEITREAERRMAAVLERLLGELDPSLPAVVTAHAAVRNAVYSGTERTSLEAEDPTLPLGLLCSDKVAYVALGHIHRFQDLNRGRRPPVVYAGSIERVDFSEEREDKGFVAGEIIRDGGSWTASYEFVPTPARAFRTLEVEIDDEGRWEEKLRGEAAVRGTEDAVVRVRCKIRNPELRIDGRRIRHLLEGAFSVTVEPVFEGPLTSPRSPALRGELDPIEALRAYISLKPELRRMEDELIARARALIEKAVESEP